MKILDLLYYFAAEHGAMCLYLDVRTYIFLNQRNLILQFHFPHFFLKYLHVYALKDCTQSQLNKHFWSAQFYLGCS